VVLESESLGQLAPKRIRYYSPAFKKKLTCYAPSKRQEFIYMVPPSGFISPLRLIIIAQSEKLPFIVNF